MKENKLKNLLKVKSNTIILLLTVSVFLPFYINIAACALLTLYLFYTGELKGIFKDEKSSICLMISPLLAVAIALLKGNMFGAMIGGFYFAIFIMALYYRRHITKELLEKILDIAVIFSVVCVFIILVQYYFIQLSQNFTLSLKQIEDYPGFRVDAMFLNPNYYAMMIEFFVLILIYKILETDKLKDKLLYGGIIIVNFFALYMTGCRTAWVPFLISVPLMMLFAKKKKPFILFTGIDVLGIGAVIAMPSLLPRMDSILTYLSDRIGIWTQGMKWFLEAPLLGWGPFGYNFLYQKLGGYKANHSHNILLDALLNYGVIGALIVIFYFVLRIRDFLIMAKNKIDPNLVALAAGFVATVILHGIMDNTIIWPQCAFLFLFVIMSSSIYVQNGKIKNKETK